jgi:predicted enzyme related to lactoylglutathione lyase
MREWKMNQVAYSEIPVEDYHRAAKFYETEFGWDVTK